MTQPTASQRRVLVVDDEPHLVRAVGMYLELQGYTVFGAGSGEEALDAVRDKLPDLVVLDVMQGVVAHIREQADLMAELIEEILDVQRVQLGKLPLEVSRLDLSRLAQTAAEEVVQATQTHTIRIVVDDPLPPVLVDRKRIRQVLVNLVENAVKYSDSGEIQMHIGRDEHHGKPTARVSIHDQGVGLEPADVDRIFDRFVQASGGPVRGHAGLGLALYVARQIARAHGGDVWAESAGRGRGSTFHLRLPLPDETTAA